MRNYLDEYGNRIQSYTRKEVARFYGLLLFYKGHQCKCGSGCYVFLSEKQECYDHWLNRLNDRDMTRVDTQQKIAFYNELINNRGDKAVVLTPKCVDVQPTQRLLDYAARRHAEDLIDRDNIRAKYEKKRASRNKRDARNKRLAKRARKHK